MKNNIIPFVEVILQVKPIVKVILRTIDTPCDFYQMIFFKSGKDIGVMTCITNVPTVTEKDIFELTSLKACISIDPYPEKQTKIHEVNAREFKVPKDLSIGFHYTLNFNKNEIIRID